MTLATVSWTVWRASTASHSERAGGGGGFSLLEVLFATTILTVSVGSLAPLVALSTRANTSAKATTYTAVLARQKLEQLRSLTWGFDSLGLPLTDTSTDLSAPAETPTGGKGLTPSPLRALAANTEGYCDFLDPNGLSLGGGTTPPPGAVYVRRWSIDPLPTNPNNTLVLQVLVTTNRNRGAADATVGVNRLPDEARVISVKTRKTT